MVSNLIFVRKCQKVHSGTKIVLSRAAPKRAILPVSPCPIYGEKNACGYGTVRAVDATANRLTVQTAEGRTITYDPKHLQGVSTYKEISRE